MQITETDQARQKRLDAQFNSLEGWNKDSPAAKEADADRILCKLEIQIDSLVNNTSLVALDNVDLLELYVKVANLAALIDAEALKRQ
jgi:hypothetical protein